MCICVHVTLQVIEDDPEGSVSEREVRKQLAYYCCSSLLVASMSADNVGPCSATLKTMSMHIKNNYFSLFNFKVVPNVDLISFAGFKQ